MRRIAEKYSFLRNPGLFSPNSGQEERNNDLNLQEQCNELVKKGQLDKAIKMAEQGCIFEGIPAMFTYFPLKLKQIQELQTEGEIIDEDVIQLMSLILFARREIINDKLSDQTTLLEKLAQLETILKKMIPVFSISIQNDIESRAQEYSRQNSVSFTR